MKRKYDIRAICYDKKGRVLSVGYNSYTKTHPIQDYYARQAGHPQRIFLHAEIAALLRAKDKNIHKVERYARDGSPMNASPCPVCVRAIKAWGVNFIEHTV
jgi:tRNA(Arg) A34 adenosine deaminase TadA